MSFLIAGGEKQRGNVGGETDSRAASPKTTPYDPHDFLATLYHFLGIDYKKRYVNNAGLPVPLTRGTPILGLL